MASSPKSRWPLRLITSSVESTGAYPQQTILRMRAYAATHGRAVTLVPSISVPADLLHSSTRASRHGRPHFRLHGFVIEPLTAEGRVTARILRLNIDKRVVERRALMRAGRYITGLVAIYHWILP